MGSRYRNWVLALGVLAVTPTIATAGRFQLFKQQQGSTAQTQSSARPQSAPAADNQQVANQIGAALTQARLNAYDITIDFENGTAYLAGKVPTAQHRQHAHQVVSSVHGVRFIDNQLSVAEQAPANNGYIQQVAATEDGGFGPAPSNFQPAPAPSVSQGNQLMAAKIGSALSNADLAGYDVEIRFNSGQCILSGTVATPEQKAAAESAASKVAGVSSVENRLQVSASAQRMVPQGPQFPVRPVAHQQPGYPQHPGMGHPGMGPQQGGFPAHPASHAQGGFQPGSVPAAGYAAAGAGAVAAGATSMYNQPNMPEYAWPAYAQSPNYAQVTYPKQYSASAWPYIGPFYPYPQVPLGWRKAQLEWDDGYWNLNFNPRTDKWWWFFNPKNW